MNPNTTAHVPYGPDNPPPPPSEPPPYKSQNTSPMDEDTERKSRPRNRPPPGKRRRAYALAEANRSHDGDKHCTRSRSPPRSQDITSDDHYRDRSPIPSQRFRSLTPPEAQNSYDFVVKKEGVRCYACSELGHKAYECRGNTRGFQDHRTKNCFRCGESDHLARDCYTELRMEEDNKFGAVQVHSKSKEEYRYPDSQAYSYEQEASSYWRESTARDFRAPKQETFDRYIPGEFPNSDRDDMSQCEGTKAGDDKFDNYQDIPGEHAGMVSSDPDHKMGNRDDWGDHALAAGGSTRIAVPNSDKKVDHSKRVRFSEPGEERKSYQPYNSPQQYWRTTRATPGKQVYRDRSKKYRTQSSTSNSSEKDFLPFQDPAIHAPPTASDLRGYDYHIHMRYAQRPKEQRFVNGGNGKVAPSRYGSEQRHDLGLCFTTFLTRYRCEMGLDCPWRHHPLSNAERAWIIEYGKERGKEFLNNADRWWSFPEVPVPGSNIRGLGDD